MIVILYMYIDTFPVLTSLKHTLLFLILQRLLDESIYSLCSKRCGAYFDEWVNND